MISRWLSILSISALLLAACAPATPAAPAGSDRLQVVATFSILGDMVRNVGGDAIDLTVLVGPDSDTHTYEPSPADSAALADAQVLVENGLELESWVDELVAASGTQATRVAASDGITPRAGGEHEGEEHEGEEHEGEEHEGEEHEGEEHAGEEHEGEEHEGEEHEGEEHEGEEHEGEEHAEGHDHGDFDPHIWQSVTNAMQMVRNIQAGLSAADPDNAGTYQANAEAYLKTLEELDGYVKGQVASVPEEQRKIVTNHDALGYFADAYGFTVVGDVLGAVSTEASEPSAQELAALSDRIRSEGVTVIFTENVVSTSVAEALAREADVKIGGALYTDALTASGGEADTYVKMIRANVDTLVAALK